MRGSIDTVMKGEGADLEVHVSVPPATIVVNMTMIEGLQTMTMITGPVAGSILMMFGVKSCTLTLHKAASL